MTTKFIQPVSMRVTKKQYMRDLREPLLAMGYEEILISDFGLCPILTNNYGNNMGLVSNTDDDTIKLHSRHYIPDYNPEYFLAVAAMTSEKYGIVGEWWKCVEDVVMRHSNNITYYKDKLYKSELENCITNEYGRKHHIWIRDTIKFEYFVKSDLNSLINKFEPKTNKNTNNMELTQQEKEVLARLVNKDNEVIFAKLGVKRDKNPIKRLGTENETLKSILHYICVAFGSAEAIDRKDLIGRSFTITAQNNFKFILHEKDGLQVLEITEK